MTMDELGAEMIQARRMAIRRALVVGAAGALACLAFGKGVQDAAIDGSIVAFGGLVAWATYHLISRRPDGLMIACLNTLPLWRLTRDPWLPTLVISSLAMLGVGVVLGLVNRPQAEGDPSAEFAWWDAEVDGPR